MCEYTLEEVGTHCTKRSCWIIVHNKVYDVTDFMDEVRINNVTAAATIIYTVLYIAPRWRRSTP